ncbi:hypothetical protein [Falsirhodobacter xinxiangensis]|uniref:hypothetical protein n=1 Tax=Falsirhodobacter xinxiangensis TaxID=2530049 RepID=UPI0010AA8DDD|nr:hypothetical protein [Rhodobacter xinxiangensis]
MISFAEAVDFAFESLKKLDCLPDEADKLAAFVVRFCEIDDRKSLSAVIEASLTQTLSFDALSRAAAILLAKGSPIHHDLAEWTARRLTEQLERPPISRRFRTGWPGALAERDLIFHSLVVALQERGLTPMRNDSSPSMSGCDAVAAAMVRRRSQPSSYKGIKEIYLEVNAKARCQQYHGVGVAVTNALIKDTRKV